MMKRRLSKSPGRIFYGWWIVTIGCILDAVKGGTYNTGMTLYFLPVLKELNLSRAATSLPFSLAKLESAVGSGVCVFFLVPLVVLIRRSPESIGLLPDGERDASYGVSDPAPSRTLVIGDEAHEFTTTEALRTPTFWLLAAFHALRNVPY